MVCNGLLQTVTKYCLGTLKKTCTKLRIAYNDLLGRTKRISEFPSNQLDPLEITSMTTTTKVVNYTEAQTAEMIAEYKANPTAETVAALAAKMGKTARSVIAKLSREKVYIAKVYVSKTGEKPVKKDSVADAIGAVLKLSEGEIESLAKANKTALNKIFEALANSKPV